MSSISPEKKFLWLLLDPTVNLAADVALVEPPAELLATENPLIKMLPTPE